MYTHREPCIFVHVCISKSYKHFKKSREAVVNHEGKGIETGKVKKGRHHFILLFTICIFNYFIIFSLKM